MSVCPAWLHRSRKTGVARWPPASRGHRSLRTGHQRCVATTGNFPGLSHHCHETAPRVDARPEQLRAVAASIHSGGCWQSSKSLSLDIFAEHLGVHFRVVGRRPPFQFSQELAGGFDQNAQSCETTNGRFERRRTQSLPDRVDSDLLDQLIRQPAKQHLVQPQLQDSIAIVPQHPPTLIGIRLVPDVQGVVPGNVQRHGIGRLLISQIMQLLKNQSLAHD